MNLRFLELVELAHDFRETFVNVLEHNDSRAKNLLQKLFLFLLSLKRYPSNVGVPPPVLGTP